MIRILPFSFTFLPVIRRTQHVVLIVDIKSSLSTLCIYLPPLTTMFLTLSLVPLFHVIFAAVSIGQHGHMRNKLSQVWWYFPSQVFRILFMILWWIELFILRNKWHDAATCPVIKYLYLSWHPAARTPSYHFSAKERSRDTTLWHLCSWAWRWVLRKIPHNAMFNMLSIGKTLVCLTLFLHRIAIDIPVLIWLGVEDL